MKEHHEQSREGDGELTALGISDPSTIRVVLAVFVLERHGVIIQGETGLFVVEAEVDGEGRGFDHVVVVEELHLLDRLVVALGVSIDADADAGLSLEDESGAQSGDLRDFHDGRWSRCCVVVGVGGLWKFWK